MELKIEKLAYGGKGLARLNNKICFVPFVLPDEVVNVNVKKEKKGFLECEPVEILEKSSDRINPPCKYFTYCGGCDYMYIQYEKQLDYKRSILIETLNRIGKIEYPKIDKVIPSENPYNYRNRTQLKITRGKLGFYKRESNEIVDIDYCYLLDENLNIALKNLKDFLNFIEPKPIEIHLYSSNFGEILVKFVYNRRFKRFPLGLKHLKSIVHPNIVGISIYENINGILKSFIRIGNMFTYETINDIKYRVSINSFFQVNKYQIKNLIDEILEDIKGENFKTAVDLYSGVGTLSLPVSKYVNQVFGVELNKYAYEDSNHNKKINNLKNVKFINKSSEDGLNIIDKNNADLVIVDPPRTGLSRKIIDFLLTKESIKNLIYVSCNPSTLARDLNLLKSRYKIQSVKMIDMFPQTYHIETIVSLKRF